MSGEEAYKLDPRRGVLIEPMDPSHPLVHEPAFGRARYAWQMHEWRQAWEAAKAAEDYHAMDRLDRAYEYVGLP